MSDPIYRLMKTSTPSPCLKRSWFSRSIEEFINAPADQILAELVKGSFFPVLPSQRDAWIAEISLLRCALAGYTGMLYLEFEIPRMGHRVDALVMVSGIVFHELQDRSPIVLTRKLDVAKQWLRDQASGNERIGIIVSSQAERLKPYAIDVRTPVNPVKWFLDGKNDVRSSYYLEDVATEFHVQGLELDWACVSWDGDFRYKEQGWQHYSFRGTKWQRINKEARQQYLKNAYRVLLTRARQGMIIFIPDGSSADPTRQPAYYDPTFAYLRSVGLPEIK